MSKSFVLLFLSVLISTSCTTLLAQENHPIRMYLGIGRQKTDIPFRQAFSFPIHSSYHIGLERDWTRNKPKPIYQSLDMNFFVNNSTGSGYQVQTQLGINWFRYGSFHAKTQAGFGLMHLFHPKRVFSLNGGNINELRDSGMFRPTADLKLQIAYSRTALTFFAAYQMTAVFRYNEDLPVLPINYLNFGLLFILNKERP